MLTEGVVLLDAGTTDVSGSLKGDADPMCAEKSSIFTPVPGGIGPLTIVLIYKNLLQLARVEQN
jgi:methylenetetrahydrofolate dehydrogenase (NADP+)/methenyltetrahydrofolate cyclohydrolase